MPIFSKGRRHVLYLHVPKTGGTAIEDRVRAAGVRVSYFDDSTKTQLWRVNRCSPQHFHAEALQAVLRVAAFDWVFMTVRHPYTRILSEFAMQLRTGQATDTLHAWLHRMMQEYAENPFARDNHIRPQHAFWLPGCAVFRQEEGFDGVLRARLSAALGLEPGVEPFPRANEAPPGQTPAAQLDEPARVLLRQFYWQDFVQFGYAP